ncbi:MAG TPA: DUF2809 domain-containing protein [Candidatus Kapabacteria bacterium]|nr:DUF2809 domain-containing protein [Candidatus Kapabacteria bacterium]
MRRSRSIYFGLAAGTVILGLASRRFRSELPWIVAEYAGDTLWAAMVYLIAATIWNRASPVLLAVGAVSFCFAIEFSQLYQAEWISSLRATRLGGLVLGYGFLWSDLLCYAAGVAGAVWIDWLVRRSFRAPSGR